MLIHHLKCRIRIIGGSKGPKSATRTDTKPELKFVRDIPVAAVEPVKAEPREDKEPVTIEPKKVDPRQVADQVYDLMVREARQNRSRSGI